VRAKLKELFDFPQRLWPGKNTKIQGYGEKKAISGISSQGVNGIYTLGKSQSSGTIPDLANSEIPTEFRAGRGVRLYGYGGIYTLERTPDEEEVSVVGQKAALQLEIEVFQGSSRICMLYPIGYGILGGDAINVFVTGTKTTINYENGTVVYTSTASGQINSWGGNEPYPSSCPLIKTTDSAVPDFDYGAEESGFFEETTIGMSSLYEPARSAMAINDLLSIDEDENYVIEFPKPNWESLSNQLSYSFLIPWSAYYFGYDTMSGYPNGLAFIYQVRYRLRNKGTVVLRVNHGFHAYNSNTPVPLDDELFETILYPGLVSPWFDSGIPSSDLSKSKLASVDRVRIGPYVNIP
jgi:hypothetical protein